MQHSFNAVQGTLGGRAIADITDLEFGTLQRSRATIAVNVRSQRIKYAHMVTAIKQLTQDMSPNKSGAARQENAHFRHLPDKGMDRAVSTRGNRQKPPFIFSRLIGPLR
jgi:hypothetical protein